MNEKTKKIVDAARARFARYGFSKTTIGDIAAEAGVARQTVYNAFSDKEEILRAVVRMAGEETFAKVTADWETTSSLADRLSIFQEHGPLTWFEVIRATPDWADLIDGMHSAAADEIAEMDAKWRDAFRTMLQDAMPQPAVGAPPYDAIADFFYASSVNAKYGVDDIAALRTRLHTIRAATLALLRP